MNRYESSAITPVCVRCGWHIIGILYYINNDGPLCAKCHGTTTSAPLVTNGDEQ